MRKIISVIVAACFIFSSMPINVLAQGIKPPAKQPIKRPVVAVADLDLKGGIPKDLRISLSNKAREILISTGKYVVLDRANQLAILDEIGIQQSGLCDSSCAVDIGRWLSAEYMVFGAVTKIGSDKCETRLQMTDVARANIVSSSSYRGGCEPEELFTAVEVVAYGILGIEMKPAKLVVNSTPDKAAVYVDGDMKGQAPLSIEVLPGRHKVMVTASGYRLEEKVIDLKPGGSQSLDFKLLKETKKWYKAWWFWGAVGVVALGGAIAASAGGGGGGGGSSTGGGSTTGDLSITVTGP